MSEKMYLVPEGMRKAAGRATEDVDPEGFIMYPGLEAAIRWLDRILEEKLVDNVTPWQTPWQAGRNEAIKEIRGMFLAPEPEFPEEIKGLFVNEVLGMVNGKQINDRIRKAYLCGKKENQ